MAVMTFGNTPQFGTNDPYGGYGGSSSQSTGEQSFFNKKAAKDIITQATASSKDASKNLLDFLNNPTANSAYNTTLQGVLSAMQPSIEQGYQNLSDMFRKAGAQQSGAYGVGLGKYAAGVNQAQTQAAGNVLGQIMPSIVQGYGGMANTLPQLLNAMKLSSQQSTSETINPQYKPGANVQIKPGFMGL